MSPSLISRLTAPVWSDADHVTDPLASYEFVTEVFNTPAPPESEDCLYLNVFAPSTPYKGEGGRAVLFWIYGGSLQFGYAGLPAYDGSSFAANQDVIVVTTAYRTNGMTFRPLTFTTHSGTDFAGMPLLALY